MALSLKERFANALFGTPAQVEGVAPSVSYGDKIDEYLNGLGSQPYMQGLLNQPKETGLTLDQYKQGVANGLNYGVPEIAQAQKELGINIPKTGEEKDLASVGQFNQPTMLSVGTATTPRQGGFFNDLAQGYQENATQGFNVQNWAPQNKGLATKIGEGLGTLARFYDKPIGRMAVATGLSMLTDEVNPLQEGIRAYVGRQTNMTKDKAYRQGLINMGVDEAQVNAIPGIVSDDIFKNMSAARQAQLMIDYRNDMLKATRANQEEMQKYRQQEFEFQQGKEAFDRMMAGEKLSLEKQKLALDWYNANNKQQGKPLSDTQVKDMKNLTDSLNDIDRIITKYSDSKYNAGFGVLGAARRNPLTSKFDPLATEMRQDIDLFKKTVAKAREGGRLTDQDQKYYEKALLNPNLTREDFLDLAREFENTVKLQRDTALDMYELQGKNVSNFRNYYENKGNQAQTQTGKYKEGQTATNPKTGAKMIYRGGTWQAL